MIKVLSKNPHYNTGFTIVELIVVIIIIGVLSSIVFVSYRSITARANEAVVLSDLANAKKQLFLYFADNNSYPTALDANKCPSAPKSDTNYCLKPSSGSTLVYYGNADGFTLSAAKGAQVATATDESAPETISLEPPTDCPTGFIPVPGSATYSTKGFCVMKYEAKQAGATTVPVSTAAGAPWANISQINAIAYSKNVAGCTGCNLISEAQWMTLAQNVLSVSSNWSGGAVGSGFIYSGHNDNVPASALAADANDTNGYSGTGNAAGSNQRRTLTLTNGQVIWDMAGNMHEWTAGQTAGGQPGTSASWVWNQWNSLTIPGSLKVNPTPVGTGLSGANTWTTTNGIGGVYSNTGDSVLQGFLRGGNWNGGGGTGILDLNLGNAPIYPHNTFGFRVTRE